MKLLVVYTLAIKDGENEYKAFVPIEVFANSENDIERINEVGNQTSKTFLSEPTDEMQYWFILEYGCRMIRFESYDIIKDQSTFDMFVKILKNKP